MIAGVESTLIVIMERPGAQTALPDGCAIMSEISRDLLNGRKQTE